jgi:energy-converting hydrogenase Eha subunit G
MGARPESITPNLDIGIRTGRLCRLIFLGIVEIALIGIFGSIGTPSRELWLWIPGSGLRPAPE